MPSKATKGGAAAAALVLAVATIAPLEGKMNDPYWDIVHVRTYCYGEILIE